MTEMIQTPVDIVPAQAWEALCKLFNRYELTDLMDAARERNLPVEDIVRSAVLNDLAR